MKSFMFAASICQQIFLLAVLAEIGLCWVKVSMMSNISSLGSALFSTKLTHTLNNACCAIFAASNDTLWMCEEILLIFLCLSVLVSASTLALSRTCSAFLYIYVINLFLGLCSTDKELILSVSFLCLLLMNGITSDCTSLLMPSLDTVRSTG